MIPQLDSHYYFSQLFWLFICLLLLVFLFKKSFVPNVNSIIEKRTSHIEKCNSEIESLDNNIKELSKDLALIQENARKKSSEIIDSAIKKASETIVKQEQALKNENDALIAETRSQLDEEMENLQSIIKEQVNTTAQIVLEKLLRS